MTIGILTYHRAHNYGAMLQAYALKTYLQENGHQVDFIDYWPDSHKKQYTLIKPIRGKNTYYKLLNIVSDLITLIRRFLRIKQFNTFRKNYLKVYDPITYTNNENLVKENYDCVIVGSDQVWRAHEYEGKYVGLDSMYFCQQVPNNTRCIAYAASMGIMLLTPDDKKLLAKYLNKFSTILVREHSLQELVTDLGFQAKVVLDPTLLLAKQQWNTLLPIRRYREQKYVLFYELMPSQEALQFAHKKAKSLNCELLIMDSIIHTIPRRGHISDASPIDFIHAIRDAEFVIATSFHGTAFSIIFEKQFITIGLKKNADRVKTLLQHINIPNNYQSLPKELPPINYSEVSQLLCSIRQESQSLLMESLQ